MSRTRRMPKDISNSRTLVLPIRQGMVANHKQNLTLYSKTDNERCCPSTNRKALNTPNIQQLLVPQWVLHC